MSRADRRRSGVFFALSSFVIFLYRPRNEIGFPTAVTVLALLGLGLLSKEHVAAMIGVFLLTDFFWNPGFSLRGIRGNWRLYVLAAAGGAVGGAFIWRTLSTASTAGFGMKDLTWYQYFFSQGRALLDYLQLFVLPAGQNLDYDFPVSHNILDHGALFALVLVAAAIGVAGHSGSVFP